MSFVREFRGFAGIRIEADDIGTADDPSIVLLHGPGQSRAVWNDVALALHQAGRHVINIDLRGHGGSEWPEDGRYDFHAFVEDLRAVLAQMRTRPVVVAASLAGWIAMAALAQEASTLAAGLVLLDLPGAEEIASVPSMIEKSGQYALAGTSAVIESVSGAASQINIPVLMVFASSLANGGDGSVGALAASLPDSEAVALEEAEIYASADQTEAFNGVLLEFLERKQPRFIPEFREGSDARTFRDALGCFATGVTIITAMGADGQPIGLTANSFTSVSLDPPLLLVCVANNAGSAPVLRTAERFAVNVLQIGQQPTSNRFAGKGEDRFASTPWEVGEFGTPVLSGSLSSFECARDAVHEGGDHFILVGRVLKATLEPRRDPLLYFRGKYRRLHFA
jgi:flavin reductase (DIM6/NTAB) family NADH-FMN oxidoreductase RutF/pimeloyl-ACP methyl ester carboxylesterase